MENIVFTAQRAQVSGAPVNKNSCIHYEAKVLGSLKYIYSFFAVISVWRDVTWSGLIYYPAVVHVLDCNDLNIFIFIHHTLQQSLEKKELQNVTLLYKIVGNHPCLYKIQNMSSTSFV